jgi:hypothetical protein
MPNSYVVSLFRLAAVRKSGPSVGMVDVQHVGLPQLSLLNVGLGRGVWAIKLKNVSDCARNNGICHPIKNDEPRFVSLDSPPNGYRALDDPRITFFPPIEERTPSHVTFRIGEFGVSETPPQPGTTVSTCER